MSRPSCPIRGHRRAYFQRYDMFACLECDAWLSNACDCSAEECSFAKPPRDPKMVADAPEYL